jgi:ABC-type dipeptide/oligopeptide/nickel transport system permease subunit
LKPVEQVALGIFALILFAAIFGPLIAPYDPDAQDLTHAFLPPLSPGHILGTDQLGRDLLSRLLVGARISLEIAVGATLIALVIGVAVGITAGFRGGVVDTLLSRLMDSFLAFPALVLALVIAAGLGPGIRNTMIAISVVMVPGFARLARGLTLRERNRDYVLAAQVAGASWVRISRVHLVRNIWATIGAQAVFSLAHAVPAEAALSFLGLGVQPPQPSWGNMIADGYAYLEHSSWILIFPAVAIALTVGSVSILAEYLRRRAQEAE